MSDPAAFIEVTANYKTVHIAAHPVSLAQFTAFLESAGRPVPPGVKHLPEGVQGGDEPVTGVTQVDAAAYCEWVCRHTGRNCRLPSGDELDALMPHATVQQSHGPVPDTEVWPHEKGQRHEMRGGLKPVFLCEWTRDIDATTEDLEPKRQMAIIFYPPWLREGDNPLHAHAALLASGSYTFVTFRVSYEG
jgi:hypothetical protein